MIEIEVGFVVLVYVDKKQGKFCNSYQLVCCKVDNDIGDFCGKVVFLYNVFLVVVMIKFLGVELSFGSGDLFVFLY